MLPVSGFAAVFVNEASLGLADSVGPCCLNSLTARAAASCRAN